MPRRKMELETASRENPSEVQMTETDAASKLPPICQRIRQRRIEMHLEQKTLAEELGIHKNTVSSWEAGRARPDLDLLPKLSRILSMDLYELYGLHNPQRELTDPEKALVRSYRHMSPAHRQTLQRIAMTLLREEEEEEARKATERAVPYRDVMSVRMFDHAAAAGVDAPMEEDDPGEPVYIYATRRTRQATAVFKVNGSSMEDTFFSGDLVLVNGNDKSLRVGCIYVFMIRNEVYIKEYRKDGMHSHNAAWKTMRQTELEGAVVIGCVIGKLEDGDFASAKDIRHYQELHPEDQDEE